MKGRDLQDHIRLGECCPCCGEANKLIAALASVLAWGKLNELDKELIFHNAAVVLADVLGIPESMADSLRLDYLADINNVNKERPV